MKRCITCKETKVLSAFYSDKNKKDGLSYYCDECSRKRDREYYAKNRDKRYKQLKNSQRIRRDFLRLKIYKYLDSHPCVDCGEKDIVTLDFDHLRDKEKGIAEMISHSYSWNTLYKEIQKCEVVCSNCHRRRTARRVGWYKNSLPL